MSNYWAKAIIGIPTFIFTLFYFMLPFLYNFSSSSSPVTSIRRCIKSRELVIKILLVNLIGFHELISTLHFYYNNLILSGDVETNPGPSGISLCHINVRGLSAAKLLAIKHSIQHSFDIITLSETFLSNTSAHDLHLDNYHPIIRRDRDTFGGGVAAYISSNLAYIRRQDLELAGQECLWLQINALSRKFLIAVVYRPPNSDNSFWEDIEYMYDNANADNSLPIIITGDLNADPNTRHGNYLEQFAASNLLTVHINKPTRITEISSTILDQFISNCPNLINNVQVHPPLATNDHCTISLNLQMKIHKPENFKRHVWVYKNADFNGLNNAIRNFDWDSCFQSDSIDDVLEKWTASFLNLARAYIPNRIVTIRTRDVPWFSNELRKLKREKDRIHKIAKQSMLPVDWQHFRRVRNMYVGKLREAEYNYKQELAKTLQDPSQINSKKWWQLTKSFIGKYSDTSIPPLLNTENNTTVFDAQKKSELLNKSFLSFSQLDETNAEVPQNVTKKTEAILERINIHVNEVLDVLLNLDPSKASGPDMISSKMLKETAHTIAPSLARLISLSLDTTTVPQGWKDANVIPIFKKGNKSMCENYRPISLLNITAKICEKIVFKHIFNYIKSNDLITSHQSGFTPNDSTVNQLVYLYNLFAKALNDKKDIRLVFCDQSKAFDRVWHNGLLYKLKTFGIVNSLHDWLHNYLSRRRQRVTIRNSCSSWGNITAGVPQGSVLGPLLFLIHINDIIDNIQSHIKLFADDTSLFVIVDQNEIECSQQLNRDLNVIDNWAKTWLVKFNPDKTESLYITLKSNIAPSPLTFDNQCLKSVEHHKHLGITFNNNLSWNHHIDNIYISANLKLILLSKLKNILDRKTLYTSYTSFIRPTLEYGSVIWNSCTQNESDRLESIQRRAMRIITGCISRTSSSLLYEETGLEKLSIRRERSILLLFHKIMNNNVPSYLSELRPSQNSHRHQRNLRNHDNLDTPFGRIAKYQNSFLPTAIMLWNKLSLDTRNITTYSLFKSMLEKEIPFQNPLYNLGNRKLNIIMASIRMKCSILNGHLFNLKLTDDPRCRCGYFFEDTTHYFLVCPLYLRPRAALQAFVYPDAPFTLNTLLLQNNNDLDIETLKNIYLKTIEYVKHTGRFD